MKNWKQFKNELPLVENILLGRTVLMGDRKARIVSVVSVGETSRYDFVYSVKFQDGVKVEMHDSQIRPFLEEHGAGEEATDELDDTYREDTPGEELDEGGLSTIGKYSIPANKQTTDIIQHPKSKILLNVKSALGPTTRFVVIQRPLGHKGELRSNQDKVLMATISDPERGRIKMFAYHGTHVNVSGAMKFAKNNKLIQTNPVTHYQTHESVEQLGEERWSDLIGDAVLQSGKIKQGSNEKDKISAIHKELVKRIPKRSSDAIDHFMNDRDFLADTLQVINYGLKESVQLDEGKIDALWQKFLKKIKMREFDRAERARKKEKHKRNVRWNKNMGIAASTEKDEASTISESSPANAVGGGMSPHFGGEGDVQGYDPLLGKKKKKRKKFAGTEVFELTSDEYHKCMNGRKKYERWSRKMNMEDIDNQEIRSFAHKNPGKAIVIQDKTTGIMSYLIHGDKK